MYFWYLVLGREPISNHDFWRKVKGVLWRTDRKYCRRGRRCPARVRRCRTPSTRRTPRARLTRRCRAGKRRSARCRPCGHTYHQRTEHHVSSCTYATRQRQHHPSIYYPIVWLFPLGKGNMGATWCVYCRCTPCGHAYASTGWHRSARVSTGQRGPARVSMGQQG